MLQDDDDGLEDEDEEEDDDDIIDDDDDDDDDYTETGVSQSARWYVAVLSIICLGCQLKKNNFWDKLLFPSAFPSSLFCFSCSFPFFFFLYIFSAGTTSYLARRSWNAMSFHIGSRM